MNKFLFVFAILSSSFVSCEKAPGSGGKAGIHVTVISQDKSVEGATVSIKYGATAFPGEGASYDETTITDYAGDVSFENLKRGDYYLYAINPDTSAFHREGGAHVHINNKPGEQHVVIDFSEEDPF